MATELSCLYRLLYSQYTPISSEVNHRRYQYSYMHSAYQVAVADSAVHLSSSSAVKGMSKINTLFEMSINCQRHTATDA